ncbi:MAG: helix-turn-helix transcriptional regulator [Actinomycetota bacterium]|nr:helix-turn-helix transcriptional regulator [Nitrospiraceae bacterium]MDA8157160.1 helix-turn-helix transcriptional regulator [Actinomycetota bacterium]
MKHKNRPGFVEARPHAALTTGEVIKMLRQLKGWTQAEFAKRCGISATNISLLENGKVEIGKRRSEQIAEAFGVHPAIIMFPEYEGNGIKKNAA